MARSSSQSSGSSSKKGNGSGAKASTKSTKASRGRSSGGSNELRGNASHAESAPVEEPEAADAGAGRDIAGVVLAVVAVVSLIAVVSSSSAPVTSALSTFLHLGFGLGAYVLPFAILAAAVCLFLRDRSPLNARSVAGVALIFVAVLAMLALRTPYTSLSTSAMFAEENLSARGGYVGAMVASLLQELFGKTVSMVILVGLVVLGLVVIGFSISGFFRGIANKASTARERRRAARDVEVNQEPWGDADAVQADAVPASSARTTVLPGRGRAHAKGDDDGSKTTFLGSRETTVLDREGSRGASAAAIDDSDDDDDDPLVDISDQLAAERAAERAETVLIPVKDRYVEVQEPIEVVPPERGPAHMAPAEPIGTLRSGTDGDGTDAAAAPAGAAQGPGASVELPWDDDVPAFGADAADGATTVLDAGAATTARASAAVPDVAEGTAAPDDAAPDTVPAAGTIPAFLNRSGNTVLLDATDSAGATGSTGSADKRPGRSSRASNGKGRSASGAAASSGSHAAQASPTASQGASAGTARGAASSASPSSGAVAAAAGVAASKPVAAVSVTDAASASEGTVSARGRAATPAKGTDAEARPLPPMSMLRHNPQSSHAAASDKELEQTAQALQDTLAEFNLHAKVVGWISGPTVTTFKVQPGEGERVSRIANLEDDIALSLATQSVRIFAPIPDTSLVGIEIPNRNRQNVYLADVLPYVKGGPLELAIGRDAEGTPVVADLAKMPHLLIAGTTGSGKSVMINSIVVTLLMRTQPEDVRLIMIDPKRVELAGYNGLPHLYVPVVTEAKQAASALQWAVSEMERRLKVFEKLSVRKISTYNEKQAAGVWAEYDNPPQKMPYLVIIIDELSDLMMVAGKDVEASIVRIAQLGRAAGIHLIVATQRPSANVVTGLIKANITNRIAFNVATGVDSRVIIDQTGAEKLTGNGDMLFSKVGWGKPKRIQGCYVSDEEIASVVDFVKEHGQAEYHEEILSAVSPATVGGGADASDEDPLLWEAAHIVVESQLGSTSGLQRRLKVGYARAGRIMDMLEEKGVVGPPDGSKPREVLLDEEGLAELESIEARLSQGEVDED